MGNVVELLVNTRGHFESHGMHLERIVMSDFLLTHLVSRNSHGVCPRLLVFPNISAARRDNRS